MCKKYTKMNTKKLLDELKIDNRETLLEFIVIYSRIEFALKRTNFTKTNNGDAEANWEKFISHIKSNFNPNKNEQLKNAVQYLLSFPTKKQILKNGNLDFVEHPGTKTGPEILRIYHCIRIVRNNLFHGGKFPQGPITDISRNSDLIENSITILKEFVSLDQNVHHFFIEFDG